MRVADSIAAVCVALLGAIAVALARQLPYEAEYGPGPGFLPFWLGVSLIVLSVFLLREARLKRTLSEVAPGDDGQAVMGFAQFTPGALTPWLIFFVSTIALALFFERLGFGLSVALFMLITMRWVARQSWFSALIFAVITPIVLYVGFVRLLMVPLPLQPVGF